PTSKTTRTPIASIILNLIIQFASYCIDKPLKMGDLVFYCLFYLHSAVYQRYTAWTKYCIATVREPYTPIWIAILSSLIGVPATASIAPIAPPRMIVGNALRKSNASPPVGNCLKYPSSANTAPANKP